MVQLRIGACIYIPGSLSRYCLPQRGSSGRAMSMAEVAVYSLDARMSPLRSDGSSALTFVCFGCFHPILVPDVSPCNARFIRQVQFAVRCPLPPSPTQLARVPVPCRFRAFCSWSSRGPSVSSYPRCTGCTSCLHVCLDVLSCTTDRKSVV